MDVAVLTSFSFNFKAFQIFNVVLVFWNWWGKCICRHRGHDVKDHKRIFCYWPWYCMLKLLVFDNNCRACLQFVETGLRIGLNAFINVSKAWFQSVTWGAMFNFVFERCECAWQLSILSQAAKNIYYSSDKSVAYTGQYEQGQDLSVLSGSIRQRALATIPLDFQIVTKDSIRWWELWRVQGS